MGLWVYGFMGLLVYWFIGLIVSLLFDAANIHFEEAFVKG
jgi:hypothetical protein